MATTYAVFTQIFNATNSGGTSFVIGSDASNGQTAIRLFPVNPDVYPNSTATFAGNGSTKTVWLKIGSATAVEGTLTNAREMLGNAQSAEDIWVVKVGTTSYVLTSGGYTTQTGSTLNINASIKMGQLDLLVQEQTAATPGLVVSNATLVTVETGTQSSFTVSLKSEPASSVTITLSGVDATEGSFNKTTLTFTTANWNTPQLVTVTGLDDDDQDGDVSYTVTLTAESDDPAYDPLTASVDIKNVDNETLAVESITAGDATDLEVVEGGALVFLVTLTAAVTDSFSEFAISSAGSASAPGDYNPVYIFNNGVSLVGGKLRVPQGVSSFTVTVRTTNDSTFEETEGFDLTVGGLTATGTILDDEDMDRDGIALAIENRFMFHADGVRGDFNNDGVADSGQSHVTTLPVSSYAEFAAGTGAKKSSFGSLVAGTAGGPNDSGGITPDTGAQFSDVAVLNLTTPQTTALTGYAVARTGLLDFTVTAKADKTANVVRLVQNLKADAYVKWNATENKWQVYEGAKLLDTNGDGRIEQVVLSFVDGGLGDDDRQENGSIRDPGMLVEYARAVYSVLLKSGDRFYTADVSEAANKAKEKGARFEGVAFDSMADGTETLTAYYQKPKKDWFYGLEGQKAPYACYKKMGVLEYTKEGLGANGQEIETQQSVMVTRAGSGAGVDFHMYLNRAGRTVFATTEQALEMGLRTSGYKDMGAKFNTTMTKAFTFDAKGFLVANSQDDGVIDLVEELLSKQNTNTNDAKFIDAVEDHYLANVTGLLSGGAASVADLEAAFSGISGITAFY